MAEVLLFHHVQERTPGVRRFAEKLPAELVYAGFSMGALPAQMLAQTRPGAKGALLLHACVPVSDAARLLTERVLTFLDGVKQPGSR